MNSIMNGWFSEVSDSFPGQAFSLKVREVLFEGQSKFQNILIFESENYGRVLVLDDHIQLTERDESFYQEMISYIPINVHPNPRRVLIIGGGDGGVAREVVRHSSVEHVDLVDIDGMVIETARKYLPFMATGLNDPKVTVHVDDGFAYLKKRAAMTEKYDVIITDSTDPGGPSTPLFNQEYFQLLSQALNDDGIICNQGETLFLDIPVIKQMIGFCKAVFPSVGYAYNIIPTYTSGHLGYVIASKTKNANLRDAIRDPPTKCKFYTKEVHKAAFCLPKCYDDVSSILLF
ncbi:unnamed protein product [Rodentolepis nana]|uniref:PABS domain-containing protein n=1 Tax=Rodentolepis nana TaxID=102285 RepID=A0A0R3TW86_RODNA|nr:unnamed protein product [Rodentolepis nana]